MCHIFQLKRVVGYHPSIANIPTQLEVLDEEMVEP